MGQQDPRVALLNLRVFLEDVIEVVGEYDYRDIDERLARMKTEAREIFRLFDHYYSDPTPTDQVLPS